MNVQKIGLKNMTLQKIDPQKIDLQKIHLRELTHREAAAWAKPLSLFAAQTWSDAFTGRGYYTPEIVKGYTDVAFTEAGFDLELADPRNHFFIVELDGRLVGYAKLEERPTEPCILTERPIYLSRFYLDRSVHGTGVAKKFLDFVTGKASTLGFRSLWLSVWELNVPAVKFYEKHHFVKAGEWEYPFTSHGKQYIDIDWLMAWTIAR
jgi:diamine N-acetyltransferase